MLIIKISSRLTKTRIFLNQSRHVRGKKCNRTQVEPAREFPKDSLERVKTKFISIAFHSPKYLYSVRVYTSEKTVWKNYFYLAKNQIKGKI